MYQGAVTDLVVRPIPPVLIPGATNSTFQDTSFNRTIKRLTNGTSGSTANISHRTPSSENSCAWGKACDRFYAVNTYGVIEYFIFDPVAGNATYVKDLPFSFEPTFSRVSPTLVYGIAGFKVLQIDTGSMAETTLLDLAVVDPPYAVSGLYMNGLQSSGAPESWAFYYGGAGQDLHFRVLFYNGTTHHILDTQACTIDGTQVAMPACHVHSIGLDQAGRYVIVYPTSTDIEKGIASTYIWDTQTGTVQAMTVSNAGHACDGYGVHLNNDTAPGVSWDWFQYCYRTFTNLANPMNVIVPPLTPKEIYAADHANWNCASPTGVVPFVTCTYRYDESTLNTVPFRACDNELLSVDPVSGIIYRWCHHFSNVYSDTGNGALSFWYEPIPQVSPDGRWLLFDSNMNKTLGTDTVSTDPTQKFRTDLFLVDTKPATIDLTSVETQLASVQAALTTLQTYIEPFLGN